MDLLCRALEVQITPQAQPFTSCVYADDLLLFGVASSAKAEIIIQTLNRFSLVSGQKIGPEKSSIWFNWHTLDTTKLKISNIFSVTNSNLAGKYLGTPVSSAHVSYNFLIEKVSSRL